MKRLIEARKLYNEAVEAETRAYDAIENAPEDTDAEALEVLEADHAETLEAAARSKALVEKLEKVEEARSGHKLAEIPELVSDTAEDRSRIVVNEKPTYEKNNRSADWVRDLYNGQVGHNLDALQRLSRNNAEVAATLEARGIESRTVVTSAGGSGAGFVPPVYVTDQFIALARPHSVFANECAEQELPPYGDTVNYPRVATGTETEVQSENGSVADTAITTELDTATVLVIAGKNDVSRLAIERSAPGLTDAILGDLCMDYAIKLDKAILSGTYGVLNDNNIEAVTLSVADVAHYQTALGQAKSKIESARYLAPTSVFMHPRRWEWFASQVDTNGRPVVVPTAQNPFNAAAVTENVAAEGAVGTWGGLNVYLDPNMPTNLGATTNEDAILVGYMPDAWLFNDPSGIRQFTFQEVLSANNNIRLMVTGYHAFATRHSSAFASITGAGLLPNAGF